MRTRRHQVLLSTVTLVGTLAGYGRSAYAACAAGTPPTFECSGANNVTQTINLNDATVSTAPNFNVITANFFGVTITGNGALSYTDENGSEVTSAGIALSIISNDDIAGGNDGSVTVDTNGALTGGNIGVFARNYGGGSVRVETSGDVTGTSAAGISAQNGTGLAPSGTYLTVITAADTTVMGGDSGITASNYGSGAVTVTTYGDVTGTSGAGILARNGNNATPTGTNLTVTTGAGTTVTGGDSAIIVNNQGSGTTDITANGNVAGTDDFGILAQSGGASSDFTVTTAAGTTVSGGSGGISATNAGIGELTVTANGDVTGTSGYGIVAQNGSAADPAGTNVTVTTAAGTMVSGGSTGIFARNFGSGATAVAVNGDVTSATGSAILAQNGSAGTPAGTDVTVTTAAGTNVNGDNNGILARNFGNGALNVEVNGDVAGTRNDGIRAYHEGTGTIGITIAESGTVTSNGADAGDFAVDTFSGPANLTVAGTLNGGGGGAVRFDQNDGVDNRLELRTTAEINGTVLGGDASDTLAFAGSGNGAFDLGNIDTGGDTQQYRGFEVFQVESATWTLNGVTSADFIVEGGTVRGNGTFGSLTVNNGTLAPGNGNDFGTMTVNGVFSLNAGAIFEVGVNAANMGDKVVVNGTVNLTGATLRILAANGNYELKTDYVIIDNDGNDAVNGEFGTITSTLAFLVPTVAYDGGTGNDVVLTLERNDVDPCDVANTQNQKGTCGAIDPDDPLFVAVLNQTVAGARQAFNALSGEIHGTVAGTLADDSRYPREAVLSRLMQASHSGEALGASGPQVAALYDGKSLRDESLVDVPLARAPLAFWTSGFGAWGNYNGDGNAASADRDLGGFISGMDADVGGSWRAGLATGASFSSVDVDARTSSADVETYYLGGYLGGMVGSFALRGGGLWAWNSIDTSRAVVFPGFFERQSASYDADTGQIFGEVAYPTQMGSIALEPFAGLAFVSVDTDSFRERGGPLASLRGVDADQDVGYTTLGLRAATTMQWGGTQVTPHIAAAWQHAFDDVTPSAGLAFASTGNAFTVDGVPLAEDSALLDAGLDFALGENASAGVSYSGQFGDGVTDNAVKGRITWLW